MGPPIFFPLNIPFQRQRNIPEIQSNRPMVHSPFAPRALINRDEIRETIVQNLIGVKNMIDFGNYNEFKENKDNIIIKEEYDMNCFDLDKRILIKGQWVYVKDTIDKWLEAQVIEISEDKKKVKIHYNHWDNRWDEWININSPRIMPFRYHTRQNTLTHYNSPSPNQKPDSGITLLSNINNNINNNDINQEINNENNFLKNMEINGFVSIFNEIEKINKVISGLSKSFLNENDNINSNRDINIIKEKQKKFYYNLKRLIPLMNRTGKIYSDISTFFEHAIINNNLDLIDKKLFSNINNVHEDIKFFSFEERMKIVQEIFGKYSERERTSGTLNYVPPMNKFDTKLINNFPIMDTPLMIGRKDLNINSSFNTSIINNNNNNSNIIKNMQIERFNFEYNRNNNNIINILNNKKEINDPDKNENDEKNKIIGIKTKRDNIKIADVDDIDEKDQNKKKK